ncbi:MAG: NACHT domain-containing protein [Anaerolineae bacterium]|nr:NACHT domain-containing protein [Anaerolineae bacterium]
MGRWLWERRIWGAVGSGIVLAVALRWYMDVPLVDGRTNYEALVTLLLSAGTFIGMLLSLIPWLRETLSVGGKQKRADDLQRRNRAALIKAVDEIWISGFLDKVLHQMESLQIDLRYLEPEKAAQRMGGQPYALKDNRAALQTFRDFGEKLVILGEPGAGKTVLLLQLAEGLLGAAQQDATAPVPVIFPLSAWAEKQLPFGEWLQGELQNRYGAPKGQAAAWVGGEQLIFLLDGLDEVNAEQREACLRAIQAFVEDRDRRVQYILCSRRKEYVELVEQGAQLNVPGEIVLKALEDEAIQRFLAGNEFGALRALLDENALLREDFARIPFLLNTMAYVTRGDTPEKARLALGGRQDAASLRDYFLEEYVSRRLREQPHPRYPAAQTRRWLRWLAGQLIRERQTDFYLENMQPWWLDSAEQARGWRRRVGLMVMLTTLVVVWLTFGLALGLQIGRDFALTFGVVLGLLMGFVVSRRTVILWGRSHELVWDWRALVVGGVVFGLIFGVLFVQFGLTSRWEMILLIGLSSGILFALQPQTKLRFRDAAGWFIQSTLRIASERGLGLGLVFGMVLMFGYTIGFGEDMADFLLFGALVGSAAGLAFGLEMGLGAFIQHYVLRFMLWRSGHLPYWRYDRFLDYAAALVILRQVGGGYRFAHDLVRGHLAGGGEQGLGDGD